MADKVKHMKNYAKVKKLTLEYFEKQRADHEKSLEEARAKGDEQCIARLEPYLAGPYRGKPRKHTLLDWQERTMARIEEADKAGVVDQIDVNIEWTKSRTWGMCPHAEVWVRYTAPKYGHDTHYGEGSASGCGYDKRSAAFEDAVMCPAIDRLIIEHMDKMANVYAVDKLPFPHLSISGKGMECMRQLLEALGWKGRMEDGGKTWDVYHYKKQKL